MSRCIFDGGGGGWEFWVSDVLIFQADQKTFKILLICIQNTIDLAN